MLGKYRLLARLGQGGMAEVYLAVVAGPAGFNKLQVVKVMKPELLEEPEHRIMFLEEGRLAASLNHPNIVQTNEVQIDGDHHFIAMEYLDGQPLHRIVRRGRKTPEGVPLNWHLHFLCEVLTALEYAHAATGFDGSPLAVVHRDVTPHNVFVTYTGQVKLCDFGIAKTMSSSVETRHGVLKGKVSYMAPEQVLGNRVDRRADLFSVGVMLWEAATGSRMWKDQSDLQIMQALSQGRIQSARSVNPTLDVELEQLIDRALAPNPVDRYPSARDFRKDLETYLFSQTVRIKPDQMGRWVASLFEKERENLQKVIQAQLSGRVSSAPPALDPPRAPAGDSSPSRSGLHDPRSMAQPGRSMTIPSVEVSTGRRRSTWAAIVGALGASVVFLMLAVVVLVLRGRSSNVTPSVEALPQGEARPAAEPAPEVKRVRVRIHASPADAKLTLDGRALGDNPWIGEVPRDDLPHRLVISREGYEPLERTLRFDHNLSLELSLTPKPNVPAPTPQPRVMNKPTTAEEPPEPTAPKKPPPSTQLDTSDPW